MLIDERLREPALAAVLDATPQGLIGARETLLLEMARYQPNDRTSARDLTALVRIYLLSRIDVLWWQDAPTFLTDDQVNGSAELVDLEWLRRRDLLRFRYQEQPATMLGRAARGLRRRLRPDATPRTAGLLFRRARREVVALLNDIGTGVRRRRAAGHPAAVGDQPGPQRRAPVPAAPPGLRRDAAQRALPRLLRRRRDGLVRAVRRARTPWPSCCWTGRRPASST